MPTSFSVSADLSDLLQLGPVIRANLFGQVAHAVQTTAAVGVERWQRAVLSAPLWEGERREYAASIRYQMKGQFAAEIVSDYKYVEDIERGRPPRDLKLMLNTSLKVRVAKDGKRYLIIPFRHNTPGNSAHAPAMPEHVYDQACKLKTSSIAGHRVRWSGTGAFDVKTRELAQVRQRMYRWGGRLADEHGPRQPPMQGPGVKGASAHKNFIYDGMVKMQTTTPGGKKSSSYMTFRVMKEGSTGWIVPARPGMWIAKAVAESLQRTAETDIAAAVRRDIAA